MALPTKAAWTTLKSNAQISKTPWWKPADAAVGPALGKVEDSKAKWKAQKILKNAESYFSALCELDTAFDKFVDKKNLTTAAAGNMANQIAGWKVEVHAKKVALASKMPALRQAKAEDMDKGFDEFIL